MNRENIGSPITVVYVDKENPEAEIRRRCAALGLLDMENFHIWGDWQTDNPPPVTFDDPRLIECARRDNSLFVFDSLSSFLDGADENDSGAMMQIMGKARLLARACSGVIILHHQAKNGPVGVDVAARLFLHQQIWPSSLRNRTTLLRYLRSGFELVLDTRRPSRWTSAAIPAFTR